MRLGGRDGLDVTLLSRNALDVDDKVCIHYHLNGSAFNLW